MKIILNDRQEVEVKTGQIEDALFCFNLIQENMQTYHPAAKTFEQYKTEFIPQDIRIVFDQNKNVGFFEFQEKKDAWYLWDMQLSKNVQNKGLGSQILSLVESEVAEKGGKKIILNVYKTNPAIKLYKRNGYEVFADNGDRYAMSKDLI